MSKDKEVVTLLNDVLSAELTAVNQYFLHAELCSHWGYERLYGAVRKQSIGEMKHAEELIERILFLDGLPNVQKLGKINIGENVAEMFDADLALENEAMPRLTDGIELCRKNGDTGSRLLLEKILASEEEHIDWLQTQKAVIQEIGLPNYLAQQVTG
jgi:bacterioferritin